MPLGRMHPFEFHIFLLLVHPELEELDVYVLYYVKCVHWLFTSGSLSAALSWQLVTQHVQSIHSPAKSTHAFISDWI